ncbi:protein asteroid isoform X1 [Leptinotarsa decemlineata]|uniref:protein asteroid isoform X1 n=1 Tax=Leptinotarsa decemlineata TaxID=7539 RepID=UPI003D30A78E
MGIKGLTTFVRNKSEFCMERFELHDTDIVIDGDAVLCQLYLRHTFHKNACFGGDYDKFGNTIYKFFLMLSECKVTPYVILDGGYESRKMDTILERFKSRLEKVTVLNPRTQNKNTSTPLFIRETFEDIAVKLNIKMVRCDFEGDRETASIAKVLNCPVMSNDSDFFIFNVPYIPFLNLKMSVIRSTKLDQKTNKEISYRYIPCEIYKIDKFIACVGGMKKENLPLLSAAVGNDFMKGVSLSKLNLCKGNENNINMIERIEILITWLTMETKESAIEKIINSFDDSEKQSVSREIENAINGYTFVNSKYLKYLQDNPIDPEDIDKFEDQLDSTYNTYEKLTTSFPAPFIENFRKSLYPTRFLDILTQNKYYNFKPQVELDCLGHSHTPSIEIMSAVQKVLTSSQENLVCLVRIGQNVGEQVLPVCRHDLPSFRELQKMDKDARKQIILRVINIDNSFITNTLTSFPESWHLFILTLKYMINKSIISWPLVYTLIICKIVISHLDPKIGFHRTVQTFNRQYLYRIREMWGQKRTLPSTYWNVKDFLNAITFEDALLVMSQVMPYFEMNNQLLRDYRSFDRALMHTTSQFQSVLLHVKCLNQLFNMPFADFLISDCFNGTFVYNLTENLTRRPDVDNFLNYCFRKSPLIMHIFELIVSSVKGESRIPLGEKRRRIDVCQSSHMNVVYN